MADINALIAQGMEPLKLESPVNQLAKLYQLKAAQQEMTQREQDIAENNALRQYLQSNPDLTSTEAMNRMTTGFGKTGLAYGTKLQELAGKRGEASAKQFKLIEDKNKFFRGMLNNVNTPEVAQQWLTGVYSDPDVGPMMTKLGGNLQTALQEIPTDPNEFAKWKTQAALTADKFIELNKPQIYSQSLGGTERLMAVPGLGGNATVVPGSAGEKTMTPGEAERIGLERRRVTLAERDATSGLNDSDNALLGEAIAKGQVDINKVNSRNAPLYIKALKSNPDIDLREMSFENLAAASGARSLGVQSAKMQTAAREASKMINVVNDTAALVDRGNYPTINAIQNAVDKGTGGKEIVQLNAAINALVNSYARAISPNGQPTVSDKNHAREVINSAYSKGQIGAITDIMSVEMENATAATREALLAGKEERQKSRGSAPSSAKPAASPSGPKIDEVQSGYRFKGGDPADQRNWEKL